MNYLVDTHLLLWILLSPAKISQKVKTVLADTESPKYVSVISFWEISLKFLLGKLELEGVQPEELPVFTNTAGLKILDLDSQTAASIHKLAIQKNKDSFDRMLAWQAIHNHYYLLTKDTDFAVYEKYGLKIYW